MAEKNLDETVDKLEAAVDPNTVISVGGINFTPAKLMIAGTIVTSVLGFLYGTFEVYKDYMSMKEAIQTYVAPDLSSINERMSVLEKQMEATKSSVEEATGYANEIKNDLKRDIRRVEGVAESVERTSKESARETVQDVRDVRNELKTLSKEIDKKIQKELNNPLAGK
jgi:F0F1-type ATP synthase membrane subunit b/b'